MINIQLKLSKDAFELEGDFTAPLTGVTGIFGPSGSGKTSLLRAIAGLEPSAEGVISIASKTLLNTHAPKKINIPAHRRHIAYVFQEASLFAHLSVRGNLAYAASRAAKHDDRPHTDDDVEQIAGMLGLEQLINRSTNDLSGGEQQRVAIARALLSRPKLLLMDEPLSALDYASKATLITLLEMSFKQLKIPVFYVTHSSDEIARLADNLVIMEAGKIVSFGTMNEVLGQVNSPLAQLDDAFSVLHCAKLSDDLPFLSTLRSRGGEIIHIPTISHKVESLVKLRIQARDVSLCLQKPTDSSILNILAATVSAISDHNKSGNRVIKLDIAGEALLAKISEYSYQHLKLELGSKVFAQIKSAALLA